MNPELQPSLSLIASWAVIELTGDIMRAELKACRIKPSGREQDMEPGRFPTTYGDISDGFG